MTLITKIVIVLAILAIIALLAYASLLCYSFTRTVNIFRFYGDDTYWTFSTVNFEYCRFVSEGWNLSELPPYIYGGYIYGKSLFNVLLVTSTRKQMLAALLEHMDFIKENFGDMPYTTGINNAIVSKYNEAYAPKEQETEDITKLK